MEMITFKSIIILNKYGCPFHSKKNNELDIKIANNYYIC